MFDFERWTPVWWGGLLGEPYQNLSLTLVRQRHPSWDANRTLAQAKTEFVSQALPTRRHCRLPSSQSVACRRRLAWRSTWSPSASAEPCARGRAGVGTANAVFDLASAARVAAE